jgi:DNA-directed RNA polymerase subunit N (RpoN/RPB10)
MSSIVSDHFPFIVSLNLGNSQKSHCDWLGEEAGCCKGMIFTCQKLVDGEWLVAGHAIAIVMEHPTIPPFLWSFLSNSLFQTLQDFIKF